MRKKICWLLFCFFLFVGTQAQIAKNKMNDYSRWAVEANVGIPITGGTLTSALSERTNWGMTYGAGVIWQWNRTWGFGVSLNGGKDRLAARAYAAEYLLGEDGMTYYLPQGYYDEQGLRTYYYKYVYSDIKFLSGNIRAEINLVNLFGGSSAGRWCSVLLMPGIYVNQFTASVKRKWDDAELLPERTKLSLGLGGDLALRFRLSKAFDLQLKSGLMWVTDNDFVGFSTPILARYNYMWNTSVGVIFKIPQRRKRGNVMYAPRDGECYWL